jgi:hypothetical protein
MDRDNRAHHAQYRIRRHLCDRGNFDPDEWDLPPKPKWMRQRTYEGIQAKYDHYDAILDDELAAAAARFNGPGRGSGQKNKPMISSQGIKLAYRFRIL